MFDPTLPTQGAPNSSAVMRSQLNGLKALIDTVSGVTSAVVDAVNTLPAGSPAAVTVSVSGSVLHLSFDLPQGGDGPPGAAGANGSDGSQGPPGPPFTNFVVDGVTTLNPGDPAAVQASFDGSAVRLTFGIPRGSDGASATPVTTFLVDAVNTVGPGDPAAVQATFDGSAVHFVFNIPRGVDGTAGANGTNGSDGAPGPPFTNFVVDGVTTLPPGGSATVSANFDGTAVRLGFGIPQGLEGPAGVQGPQGPPGEVTQAQLDSAILGTSSNSNAVGTLDTPFTNDPPTLADLEVLRTKLNQLINALRR